MCARSPDTRRTYEGQAHAVRPYTCFHEPCPVAQPRRGRCPHRPFPPHTCSTTNNML